VLLLLLLQTSPVTVLLLQTFPLVVRICNAAGSAALLVCG
jgi:hypothetical protein